jgi:3-hydroxybutyrate dehydrogenase
MLQGKTIVITGAASGIGRVWAEQFGAAGAAVIAADINAAALATLATPGIRNIVTDVAKADQVAAMIDFAIAETGRVDVLFNNAGLGYGRTIEASPDGYFEAHVAIHLFGCVNGMRAAIPHMRRQGYGRIINTISRVAETGMPTTAGYGASKAAIWVASRVAAQELADADILVNMLIPGPTNTAIWGKDRPELQSPAVTFPTARMLATLPKGGPSGKVFWNEKEYRMFGSGNV